LLEKNKAMKSKKERKIKAKEIKTITVQVLKYAPG